MEVEHRISNEIARVLADRTDADERPVDGDRAVITVGEEVAVQVEVTQRPRQPVELSRSAIDRRASLGSGRSRRREPRPDERLLHAPDRRQEEGRRRAARGTPGANRGSTRVARQGETGGIGALRQPRCRLAVS